MDNKILKTIPVGVKNFIRICTGVSGVHKHLKQLEKDLAVLRDTIYNDDIWERSKRRWRESDPNIGLTWGEQISGNPFIKKIAAYHSFSDSKSILEIGPGYGRLLQSCIEKKIPFSKYTGLDISKNNIDHLNGKFNSPKISFIHGDAETIRFSEKFDILISSLTLKHMFPSFKRVLKNIILFLNEDGMIFFDLIEGENRMFEEDRVTYVRKYSKREIIDILNQLSLDWVAFDEVRHAPAFKRLLVVAKKITSSE